MLTGTAPIMAVRSIPMTSLPGLAEAFGLGLLVAALFGMRVRVRRPPQ
jgi:hypothetical protein